MCQGKCYWKLSTRLVQNRQTGEQVTHWDMLKEIQMWWLSLTCLFGLAILYHVIAQLEKAYLTIFPRAPVGYDMIDTQRGAWRRVGINDLIPNSF